MKKMFESMGLTKPFLNDLKLLETQGINVNEQNYKGSVLIINADNLGSHEISGFIQRFRTEDYFCRTCYIKDFNDDLFKKHEMKTKTEHNSDIKIAIDTETIYKGVSSSSALKSSNNFHVMNPGLPPCMAHDVYKGIVKHDFALCINNICYQTQS